VVYRVHEGSVLGHKKFIAYTEDLDNVFYSHGLHHHCFADDTQMYITIPRSDTHTIAPRLQKCIANVLTDSLWFQKTPANESKTEIIWLGLKATLDILSQSICSPLKVCATSGPRLRTQHAGSHCRDNTGMLLPDTTSAAI